MEQEMGRGYRVGFRNAFSSCTRPPPSLVSRPRRTSRNEQSAGSTGGQQTPQIFRQSSFFTIHQWDTYSHFIPHPGPRPAPHISLSSLLCFMFFGAHFHSEVFRPLFDGGVGVHSPTRQPSEHHFPSQLHFAAQIEFGGPLGRSVGRPRTEGDKTEEKLQFREEGGRENGTEKRLAAAPPAPSFLPLPFFVCRRPNHAALNFRFR